MGGEKDGMVKGVGKWEVMDGGKVRVMGVKKEKS